jgi:hypothetical protein
LDTLRTTRLVAALIAVTLGSAALLLFRAEATNSFPRPRFVPMDVRVVDAVTARPVVGAMIYPYCLGGTPYALSRDKAECAWSKPEERNE